MIALVQHHSSTLDLPGAKIVLKKPDPTGLTAQAIADLLSVTVQEDVESPGMFALELQNWDLEKGEVTWLDRDFFELGTEVTVQLGNTKTLSTVIVGEITGLEPEFSKSAAPTLTVRGHDLRHRLLRGYKTRSFTNQTDSAIARKIASEAGIKMKVATGSTDTVEYVLQHNQTDLEFLQDRASRIGFEVAMVDDLLHFRPRQHGTAAVLTLALKNDLLEFHPRLSTVGQVEQVEVRGWDAKTTDKNQQAIAGTASGGKDETTKMGGRQSGPQAATVPGTPPSEKISHIIVNQPVRTKAEADRIAKAQLNEIALGYITGEGTCQGNPKLRAGSVIEITGLGKYFSGKYYVISTTHTYSQHQGYSTQFTVRRNAT